MLAIAGCAAPAWGQTPDQASTTQATPSQVPSPALSAPTPATKTRDPLESVLLTPETSPDDRRAAVAQLLEAGRFGPIQTAIASGDKPVVASVFRTILEIDGQLPEPLLDATIAYIQSLGAETDPMAVQVLAGVRTKPAITPVVALLENKDAPKPLIEAAMSTLLEQTGREDLGDDPAAWTAWWEEARWLPPREWEAMLAVAHAERARRLQRESDQQIARILDLHHKMYALTPQDQRSALLATMMKDQEPGVRALAFELAERALLNTQRLDDDVRLASIDRLNDPDAVIRASAASLLFRVGAGAEAAEAVRRAIRHEVDPGAAAAMLDFLQRRPNETDLLICLDWLGDGEPAASAAARTLASSATAGSLNRSHIRNQALTVLRAANAGTLSPDMIELLGILGDSHDRERLAGLLNPEAPTATRKAAASAIVRWPESVEVLLQSARQDPALLPMLTEAIVLHQPTANGYQRLDEAIGADPDAAGSQWLARLRRGLPPSALLATIGPGESRAQVIESVLLSPDQRNLLKRDPRLLLTQALIEARYQSGDDQGVVELMGLIEPGMTGLLKDQTTRRTRRALICLGRFEEAAQAGADETDWLVAADRSRKAGSEIAPQIVTQISERFPEIAPPGQPDEEKALTEAETDGSGQTPAPENPDSPGGMIEETLTLEPAVVPTDEPGSKR